MSSEQVSSSSNADLDYIISEIIHCDDTFCPDLRDLHMDGLFITMELKFPEIQRDLQQCTEDGRPQDECTPICMEGLERANPLFQQSIDRYRQSQHTDPLQNYDGVKYGSPFWFEGAGEVWRRSAHGSRRVTVKQCEQVRKASDMCLADPTKPNDYCFRLYGHALLCEPGMHCPYLRFPLLNCLQTSTVVDYHRLKACAQAIPNFEQCQQGFVPQNANI